MHVPLLDLRGQYESLKPELNAAIARVVEGQQFILGEEVGLFEGSISSYLESPYALGVSSGTDALLLALMALDVGYGDEVIVPTFSFFATAGTVVRSGATPVFVDIDPVTFNIDPDAIARAISSRTKAIIPVHLFGQGADMERVIELAAKHDLAVIEDAAQAIGARGNDGRRLGTYGNVGCFSFFPSKNLGAFGDAGLVITNEAQLFELLRIMRVHGGSVNYHHQVIGGNFRIDAMQAAVLSVKLRRLDMWSEARRKNAETYRRLFEERGLVRSRSEIYPSEEYPIGLPQEIVPDIDLSHIYNQFVIRVRSRDQLAEYLRDEGIGNAIYYPVPFHRQPCFADIPSSTNSFPNADLASEQVLALPIFPELTDAELRQVVDTISRFFERDSDSSNQKSEQNHVA